MIAPGILVSVTPLPGMVTAVPFTVIAVTVVAAVPPKNPVPVIVIVEAIVLVTGFGVTPVTVGAAVVSVTRFVPVPSPPPVVTKISYVPIGIPGGITAPGIS